MKRLMGWIGIFVLLSCVLPAAASVPAKEWSAEQKDVLASFNGYMAASLKGEINEIMAYFHPKFIWWDYSQKLPADYDALRKMDIDFLKSCKLLKFEGDPLEIQVEGNVAILHFTYTEVFTDPTGKKITTAGLGSATMVKQRNRWVSLSWSWIAK